MTPWRIEIGSFARQTMYLLTPEEFGQLPDGELIVCIDGTYMSKGERPVDMDTRYGHIAWGIFDRSALRQYPERRIKVG